MATGRHAGSTLNLNDALSHQQAQSSTMRCRKKLYDALSVRTLWNPLEGDTAECGNQRLLVRSFDDDLKYLAIKDSHRVPLIDVGHLALELASKSLRQGCFQHPLEVRHPSLVADIDRHTVEVV